MSHYIAKAIHPVTKQVEDALFMDDYFGPHRYGIKFEDGRVFMDVEVELPTEDDSVQGGPDADHIAWWVGMIAAAQEQEGE